MEREKVILIICDGLGYRPESKNNAILAAKMPNFNSCRQQYPTALLDAAGEEVGLPEGQMGTSEANHLVIGSGRIIYQNLVKINRAIKNGEFFSNPVFMSAMEHVKDNGSALHIKGILGDGGVHGHSSHLKALVTMAKQQGLKEVYLHLYTDGRDTPPQSAIAYLQDLEVFLVQSGIGRIASLGGRYFGMDRDNNEDRIEKHFEVLVKGNGPHFKNAIAAVEDNYRRGLNDEFIEPCLIEDGSGQIHCIKAGDAVIFANFRSDRAKQMTKRFLDEKIDKLLFATMTKYDDDLPVPAAFAPEIINNTLSEILAKNGLKQLKVTETEKYTHLTFFFNAQRYEPEKGEERILIPSNKDVATHDQKPEMKVFEIADKIVEAINSEKFDFIATNLVNCDMVGHTGNFPAIIEAVEAVDKALGKIITAAKEHGYQAIITADHGNAEETFDDKSGQPLTSHTLNPVPFILVSDQVAAINKTHGHLSDIAPTVLALLGLPKPAEMTGESFV